MSAPAYKEPAAGPATAARLRRAGRVNYIIEASTPAMLCLVRGAQSKPYTPLSSNEISEAVQPHDLSLRPSPYIAHQALLDSYKICDGYYGVHVDSKVYHANKANANAASAAAASGGAGVCHFYRTPGGCHRGAQCPFLHLDKAGQPINKGAFTAGNK